MISKQKNRVALSVYFLIAGMCFSSFASRIPTIKSQFNLSENELGNLLMILPLSALVGIPLSGWLVTRFNSRIPQHYGILLLLCSLLLLGLSNSIILVGIAFFVVAISVRVVNVAINTQSISVQNLFKSNIVGSFHAIWSLGGILGVLITTAMLKLNVGMFHHYCFVAGVALLLALLSYNCLIKKDRNTNGKKFRFGSPNKYIILLGLMVFFAAICEGGIYDWNGVYFKQIVKVEVFTYGYLVFMICMTISRFSMDWLMNKIHIQKLYIICAILVMLGSLIAILNISFWSVLLGFCLLGVGISGLFPMTYILAGKSKKYSTGIVISVISTYSTVGAFLGPPLIGYLAEYFGLQRAFIVFIIAGFMFIPLSKLVFKHLKSNS